MSVERTADLAPLISPTSIAIIGASGDRRKNSGKPLAFLKEHGYAGVVYPVNPRYAELMGWRCYPDVRDVDGEIDLAIVTLPAESVCDALSRCGEKGVKSAIVLTSGFAEVGGVGRAEEQKLASIAMRYGIRVCGPNSVGIVNCHDRVIASFSQAADGKELNPGGMALISQSGNFGTYMIELAARRGIAFSHFVSTGNEADLTFVDYAEYLVRDPRVRVIVGYIEGLRETSRLRHLGELARELRKPIIVVKVGRSSAAARSAMSHTGAMAGSDTLYDAAFRQFGFIRARDEEEVLDMLPLLLADTLPSGRNVGIVSISGGGATIMADACDEEGFNVPEFGEVTKASLRHVVPYFGMVSNPVDLTGQVLAEADLMRRCLALALADERIDAVVVFLSLMHKLGDRIAEEIISAAAEGKKPIAVSWIGNPAEPVDRLRAAGVCVTTAPGTAAVRALAHAYRYNRRFLSQTEDREAPDSDRASKEPVNAVSGVMARRLLDRLGVPVMPHQEVSTPAEAASAAERIGFPVVLKIEQPILLHKTDVDALRLGLSTAEEVASAAASLLATARRLAKDTTPTLLVERMAERGVEMLVSVVRDPQFGLTLNVGLGGIQTEIYRDISTRLLPARESDIRGMIGELRGSRLLDGFRGSPPADVEALIATMRSLAEGIEDGDDRVQTIEINPLLVFPKGRGCVAVDALVVEDERS